MSGGWRFGAGSRRCRRKNFGLFFSESKGGRKGMPEGGPTEYTDDTEEIFGKRRRCRIWRRARERRKTAVNHEKRESRRRQGAMKPKCNINLGGCVFSGLAMVNFGRNIAAFFRITA